ncbi:MAG: histidine kinase dimerization/phosphoacceptor domain -containing protein [Spirochaetia bacterium]
MNVSLYYRSFFEYSKAGLWEEDFSGVKRELRELRRSGVTDLAEYFAGRPLEITRVMSKAVVLNVNPAAVELMRAPSREDLMGPLEPVIHEESRPFLLQQILAIDQGLDHIEGETVNIDFNGKKIHILVGVTIPKEGEDLHNVLVSMMDISGRKRREEERELLLSQLQEEKLYSETMQEVSMALTSSTDTNRLLDTILEQASRIVPYSTANIRTLMEHNTEGDNDGQDKLKVQRWRGYEKFGAADFIKDFQEEIKKFDTIENKFYTGEPVIVEDTREDERWTTYPETSFIRSTIILPIRSAGKTYGILSLEHTEPRIYGAKELEKLKPFGYAAAVAFEKAELYGRLKKKLAHTESAQEKLSSSLDRKETLLKEIHHRVKNNLALISSLMNLKSAELENTQFAELIEQLQRKIYSISLLHEKLYNSGDLEHIHLRGYAEELLNTLSGSLSSEKEVLIENRVEEEIYLHSDRAIPLGLILTELFTNTVKYAHPQEEFYRITLEGHIKTGDILLSVRDNGRGFEEGFSLESGNSLGTQLITSLAEQIGGKATLGNIKEAEVLISFPAGDYLR